jgi:hypothetical protein
MGTQEEQNMTMHRCDALGLHGNAILSSKCYTVETMVLRDPLPMGYFSSKSVHGVNAKDSKSILASHGNLWADIPREVIHLQHGTCAMNPFNLPPHFVVANVHKVVETDENSCSPKLLWIQTATPKFNEV